MCGALRLSFKNAGKPDKQANRAESFASTVDRQRRWGLAPELGSAAGMGKDGDRRSDEDRREDDTAVTIDVLSAFRLPIALQNCRY